jgi:hypothetical protein
MRKRFALPSRNAVAERFSEARHATGFTRLHQPGGAGTATAALD